MTQATEHRTVTLADACVEFDAADREVKELSSVIAFIDSKITQALATAECVLTPDRLEVRFVSDRFWLLLDIRARAECARQDALAARQYAYNVWQSVCATPVTG